MKTYLLPFVLCLSLALITGCVKEPIAEISADKTEVETSESVKFSNSSQEALTYEWDFGDGSAKSTDKTPSHSWSDAGTYTVKMSAFSKKEKKKDEASITITVNDINKKFIGTYWITESLTSEYCGPGSVSYSLKIRAGSSGERITIDNLSDAFNDIKATVSGSSFTITPINGIWSGGTQWDLLSGSGSLSGNTLSYSATYDDAAYTFDCGYVWVSGSGSK